jgi:5-deoxy-glucuronate isomerase
MPDPTIHPRALPNDLPQDELRIRPDAVGAAVVDPLRAGWRYLSFEARPVEIGGTLVALADGQETCIVVLAGEDVVVDGDGGPWRLEGRSDPFAALPSALWLPDGRPLRVRIGSGSGTIAVARAPRSGRDGVAADPIVVGPPDIRVEIRGAGNASREIHHIVAPTFPADRLEVVEVLTPSGNWSSWPPHKHDIDDMPGEAVLEEIYHYRFRRREAWALQRVYRADRSRDAIWEVRDGDTVIVPDGYHPFTAAQGDDAYYLNALAGDRRSMACSFDPDLDWVRGTWDSMEPDPRLPLVGSVTAEVGRPS